MPFFLLALALLIQVVRAIDPACLFWDDTSTQGEWSQMEIRTVLLDDTSGEVKQFKVNCSSNQLAAFSVAVNTDSSVRKCFFMHCMQLHCFPPCRNSASRSQCMWDAVLLSSVLFYRCFLCSSLGKQVHLPVMTLRILYCISACATA